MQPVWVPDPWHWVLYLRNSPKSESLFNALLPARNCFPLLYLLQGCRNSDDFLDGASQSLNVVVPVQNLQTGQRSGE